MKTPKYKRSSFLITFVLLGFLLLNLTGCLINQDVKCPPDEYYTDSITVGYKKLIPYKGFDTLTFVNTTVGDTHVFIGTGITQGFSEVIFPLNIDCPGGHAKLEYNNYKFVSNTYPNPIYFSVYIANHLASVSISNSFNDNKFTNLLDVISPPFAFDTLKILNHNYFNLYQIYLDGRAFPSEYYILYNHSFGIIELNLTNGEKWNLLKK